MFQGSARTRDRALLCAEISARAVAYLPDGVSSRLQHERDGPVCTFVSPPHATWTTSQRSSATSQFSGLSVSASQIRWPLQRCRGRFHCAPGRALLLGGESPLPARQGERLADGKGYAGDRGSEGSRMAKRWPDEQEADTRRRIGVRWPNSLKPGTCTERCGVYPTGISVKAGAQYPGRSGSVPERATGVERRRDARPEVSRGHSVRWAARSSGGFKSLWRSDEGRHIRTRG